VIVIGHHPVESRQARHFSRDRGSQIEPAAGEELASQDARAEPSVNLHSTTHFIGNRAHSSTRKRPQPNGPAAPAV
jgi:hypothetical protein